MYWLTGVTGKSGQYILKELVAHADELNDYHFRFFIRSTTDTRSIDEYSAIKAKKAARNESRQ